MSNNQKGISLALAAAVIAILLLTAFAVDLAAKINGLEAQVAALVDLQEVQATTHQSLLAITENQLTAIEANTSAIAGNSDVNFALYGWVDTLSDKLAREMFDLYGQHIIPLHSYHMGPLEDTEK